MPIKCTNGEEQAQLTGALEGAPCKAAISDTYDT